MENNKTNKKIVRALFVCTVAIIYFIYRIIEEERILTMISYTSLNDLEKNCRELLHFTNGMI